MLFLLYLHISHLLNIYAHHTTILGTKNITFRHDELKRFKMVQHMKQKYGYHSQVMKKTSNELNWNNIAFV